MYKCIMCLVILCVFTSTPAFAENEGQGVVLVPCPLTVPYTGSVPSGCFAWYYTPRLFQPGDFSPTQPVWTIAETFEPVVSGQIAGVNVFGQCGGNILSGDCDTDDTLSIAFYTLGVDGLPAQRMASQMVPVHLWPAFGLHSNNCGNFESCGATRYVDFYDSLTLVAGQRYAFTLSSAFEGAFILGNTVDITLGPPDIGSVPIFGSVDYRSDPNFATTPELDSFVLLVSGLVGLAGARRILWHHGPKPTSHSVSETSQPIL